MYERTDLNVSNRLLLVDSLARKKSGLKIDSKVKIPGIGKFEKVKKRRKGYR